MGSREPRSWPPASGRALIRVDGSAAIGKGHLSRCSNLAKALARIGIAATFVRAGVRDGALDGSDVRWIPDVATEHGPRVEGPASAAEQEADAQDSLRCATPEGPPLVVAIVDQYRLGGAWEAAIRRSGLPVVVIDDLADRDHVCDLLVDQNPLSERRYDGRLLPDTMRLIGPRYALLEPDAFEGSKAPGRHVGEVRRVLVSFGGSAALEPVRLALAALADPRLKGLPVDVVTGSDASRDALIAELGDRVRPRGELEISGWVDDLPSRMRTADVAIGAGGVSNYERLHVGLPAVVLTLASNQQESSAALHREGLIVHEGRVDEVSSERLADALVRLIEDTEVRRDIARRGPALVDGSGAARCAEAVLALIRE